MADREAGRTARSRHTHVRVPTGPGKGSTLPGIELDVESGSFTSHAHLPSDFKPGKNQVNSHGSPDRGPWGLR